ncbi:MAG: TIGR03435 family protein [Armatimonadetes bacterium]|nr:TIGR03435 family protein [Akkermansiaceae bacterium]
MNVLLLKVKIPDAPGLRPGKATDRSIRWLYGGNAFHVTNMPISDLREFLESRIFHQPVIDQTGLTNNYDIYLDWEAARYPLILGSLREVLLEQLGLELVPARERIEMLVIEPAKNSAKAVLLKEVSTSSADESLWNSRNLAHLPPLLILRPTRFDREGLGRDVTHVMGQLRMRLKNQLLEHLLADACDFKVDGNYWPRPARMVLPPNLPKERYDLLLTVPDGLGALQKEIRKQFHLTVRREVREVDALVIKDKTPETSADSEKHAPTTGSISSTQTTGQPPLWRQLSLWDIAQNIEGQQGKPVLVQTASTNRFDLSIQPVMKDGKLAYDEEVLRRAFHDQLGLDIVPSREKVEMLVVEESKN